VLVEGHARRRKDAAAQVGIHEVNSDRPIAHADLTGCGLADVNVLAGEQRRSSAQETESLMDLAGCLSTTLGFAAFRISLTHFLFRSLCNRLLKRILNRFQISGIWLQAHFEIIQDRLLIGFGCGDFLKLHVAQHDFVAPDRCQALNHVAYRPLAIFVGAVGGE
jgi:hypothetical protein